VLRCGKEARLGVERELLGMFRNGAREHLFRPAPVALERERQFELIPYVPEGLIVARDRVLEDPPIGDMNEPTRALVGMNPVADLK